MEQGFWKKGSTVLDPFGGCGCGGIVCASHGLRWVGCELEPRFVAFAEANFALHQRTWEQFGDPLPCMHLGDSRRLREVLQEAGALISSPPYAESLNDQTKGRIDWTKTFDGRDHRGQGSGSNGSREEAYGSTPGQLGAMKAGDVGAVVSSPPYSSGTVAPATTKNEESLRTYYAAYRASGGGWSYKRFKEDVLAGNRGGSGTYGDTPGNLANMPAGVVSSPPFSEPGNQPPNYKGEYPVRSATNAQPERPDNYGTTEGQIGNTTGTTFWSASRDILLACHDVLTPSAVACFVVKDFVRAGQRVRFSQDWARLLGATGFDVFLWVNALLAKEESAPSLFGGDIVKRTERKSFFRRLHEKKLPPNDERRIDEEVVLFARRIP